MKAAIRTDYGGPDLLTLQDVPVPVPRKGELLIRVMATTVNRTDCGVLRGAPFVFRFFTGLPKPRFATTGTDFAGQVEAIGEGVARFRKGDRVWGFLDHGLPTHAEYFCLQEAGNVILIPHGIPYEQAAASAEGAHYALNFINTAKVKAGDRVLVYGASGGIGSAAVQILKAAGVEVTAVCNSANMDAVRSLGADRVVDYQKEDFTKGTGRYDVVLDSVGKSSWGQCKALLKPKGAYLSSELGPGNENLYLPIRTLFSNQKVQFPIPVNIRGSLEHMCGLLETGQYKPLIDRSYRLDDIAEAFRYVESGQKVGNVIVRVAD